MEIKIKVSNEYCKQVFVEKGEQVEREQVVNIDVQALSQTAREYLYSNQRQVFDVKDPESIITSLEQLAELHATQKAKEKEKEAAKIADAMAEVAKLDSMTYEEFKLAGTGGRGKIHSALMILPSDPYKFLWAKYRGYSDCYINETKEQEAKAEAERKLRVERWIDTHGSTLLKERYHGGYNYTKLAGEEVSRHLLADLNLDLQTVKRDDYFVWDNPDVDSMLTVKELRAKLPKHVNLDLVLTYDEERKALVFEVSHEFGVTRLISFLP